MLRTYKVLKYYKKSTVNNSNSSTDRKYMQLASNFLFLHAFILNQTSESAGSDSILS